MEWRLHGVKQQLTENLACEVIVPVLDHFYASDMTKITIRLS
jgi:hypothetical protein